MHSQTRRFAFHFLPFVTLILLTITLGACGSRSPATPTLGIGSTMVSPVDGAVMVYVPEGDFLMGSDDESIDAAMQLCDGRLSVCEREVFEDEQPMHKVYLDAFWIDQTEVTNEMFTRFVEETGYETDAESYGRSNVNRGFVEGPLFEEMTGADWRHPQGPSSGIDGLDDHPVVHVSWNDAKAYCDWAGRRLPTEAEWEKAARGTEGVIYPWGKQNPTGELLNFVDINLLDEPEIVEDDDYTFTAPVGTYPAGVSPYDALDMAGNIKEWVADWYVWNYYQSSPEVNPEGPSSGIFRSLRGSSWFSLAELHAANRGMEDPLVTNDEIGFRCAYTLTPRPTLIPPAFTPTHAPTSTVAVARPSPTPLTPTQESAWQLISDDFYAVFVLLPSNWNDVFTGPWEDDGEIVGTSIMASTDLAAFLNWQASGVAYHVSKKLGKGYIQVIDEYKEVFSETCRFNHRWDFEFSSYRGKKDTYWDCGGEDGPALYVYSLVDKDDPQAYVATVLITWFIPGERYEDIFLDFVVHPDDLP